MPTRRKILVVEDDENAGPLIVQALTREGFNCTLAPTFQSAEELRKENQYACIVLDPGLPDMDEESEYAVIDRIPDFNTRVVVYTASGNAGLFKRTREHGAAIILKGEGSMPFLIDAIWNEINFQDGDSSTAVAQQSAQRKAHAPSGAIEETTLVAITLARAIVISSFLVVSAVGITATVLTKVGKVDTSIETASKDIATTQKAMKDSMDTFASATAKRMDSFEAELKRQDDVAVRRDEATQKRIADWSRWRDRVTRDLHTLGDSTKVPIATPNE